MILALSISAYGIGMIATSVAVVKSLTSDREPDDTIDEMMIGTGAFLASACWPILLIGYLVRRLTRTIEAVEERRSKR